MIHPARRMSFDHLWSGLQRLKESGYVNEVIDGDLSSFCYTQKCTYEKAWDLTTLAARGLILDRTAQRVIATPFPKFFNLSEHGENNIPAIPFQTFEKLDGSLIIMYHHNGKWRFNTKGSFKSEQAKWAKEDMHNILTPFKPGITYLFEVIYAENRIVVPYDYEGLVLIGGYKEDGTELTYEELQWTATLGGVRIMKAYPYSSIADLILKTRLLPKDEEGFVVRFDDGLRLKLKGDEYVRVHAMISRLTPIAIWEALFEGRDLEQYRSHLPEEFLVDFDAIRTCLRGQHDHIYNMVHYAVLQSNLHLLSDKEIGLKLKEFPEPVRGLIFPFLKYKTKLDEKIMKLIRPNGNVLPGYTPSYMLHRVHEEAV